MWSFGLLLLPLARGRICQSHGDCPPEKYCFSYAACRKFIDSEPFVVGDLVKVDKLDKVKGCPGWVVIGSNPNGTYNVQCSSEEELSLAVDKDKLHYADAFGYNCGEFSHTGVCGLVQLCPSSHDSIDGTCPGRAQNKTAACYDLNKEFCKSVEQSPRLCAQPYHGPNVSVTCCAACARFATPPPSPCKACELKASTPSVRGWSGSTYAALLGCAAALVAAALCARRLKSRIQSKMKSQEPQELEEAAEYLQMASPDAVLKS